MIAAFVDAHREIKITVSVLGADGTECLVDAILDTGFNDALTLPPGFIAALGLQWILRESAILANGQSEEVDVYAAMVLWDGVEKDILVLAMEARANASKFLGFYRHFLHLVCDIGARKTYESLNEP